MLRGQTTEMSYSKHSSGLIAPIFGLKRKVQQQVNKSVKCKCLVGGACSKKNICSVPEKCCGPIFVMHTQKCRTRLQIQICFFFCTAQFQSNALFWMLDSVSIYYSHISHIVSMQIDSQGLDSIRIFATSLSLALKHAMQIPVHAGKVKKHDAIHIIPNHCIATMAISYSSSNEIHIFF